MILGDVESQQSRGACGGLTFLPAREGSKGGLDAGCALRSRFGERESLSVDRCMEKKRNEYREPGHIRSPLFSVRLLEERSGDGRQGEEETGRKQIAFPFPCLLVSLSPCLPQGRCRSIRVNLLLLLLYVISWRCPESGSVVLSVRVSIYSSPTGCCRSQSFEVIPGNHRPHLIHHGRFDAANGRGLLLNAKVSWKVIHRHNVADSKR